MDERADLGGARQEPGGESLDAKDSGEIRDDIEDTRAGMGDTIDEIQDRLNPQNVMDQAKESVRDATIGRAERMANDVGDTARETGGGIIETIKQNPIPAALVAIGAGWLWMNRKSVDHSRSSWQRRAPYPYEQGYGQRYLGTQGTQGYRGYQGAHTQQDQESGGVGQKIDQAQDKAGQMASRIQDQTGEMRSQAEDQMHQMQGQLDHLIDENPIAATAVALGIGAAIGMAIPETDKENEMMGQARDQMIDKAQSAAQDKMQQAQRMAGKAQDVVEDVTRDQGASTS